MHKKHLKTALAKLEKLKAQLDEIADEMSGRADDYETSVDTISDDSQERLDAYRSASDYAQSGDLADAIAELEPFSD